MNTLTTLSTDEEQYYPTPPELARKMLDGVRIGEHATVLEPSAGTGALAAAVAGTTVERRLADLARRERADAGDEDESQSRRYARQKQERIISTVDAVEINPERRAALQRLGVRVVHDNFDTFATLKRYDLIVMNPPFSAGARHLDRALDLLADGGEVRCLLNAETIRHPYSHARRALVRRLEDMGAQFEYLDGAFHEAERKTDVGAVIVRARRRGERPSLILDELRRAMPPPADQPAAGDGRDLAEVRFYENIVHRCRVEEAAGLALIREWRALQPRVSRFDDPRRADHEDDDPRARALATPPLALSVDGQNDTRHLENDYLRAVRAKYWQALFLAPEFTSQLTAKLLERLHADVGRLADYEFSAFNIYSLRADLARDMIASVEGTIVRLFDQFSGRHHFHEKARNGNVHYFNGWKSNKAHYINKKVILPLRGLNRWENALDLLNWETRRWLADVERTFNYLDGGLTRDIDLDEVVQQARHEGRTKGLVFKYFAADLHMKGTIHLTFTNADLLKKFNYFAGRHKKWLPPAYGEKPYEALDPEERAVADAFEGEASYRQTTARAVYFLGAAGLPAIGHRAEPPTTAHAADAAREA